MNSQYSFNLLDQENLTSWIANTKIARTVMKIQIHHTYIPNYSHFTGLNHFELQRSMQMTHIYHNGWRDIGQHFTIFPDGKILTGRNLEEAPACIYLQNAHSICIENLGNFDAGFDEIKQEQKDAIVHLTALLCRKFNMEVNTQSIVYHHWFHLSTGARNNGSGGNKSCPGTAFFGGNKVENCEQFFLPLVMNTKQSLPSLQDQTVQPLKYVVVHTDTLNIRSKPASSSPRVEGREVVHAGAVLRVYEVKNNWFRISSSMSHWVFSRYTKEVQRALVNAPALNVRSGPGMVYQKTALLSQGEEVFITETSGSWCKVGLDDRWVGNRFLEFD